MHLPCVRFSFALLVVLLASYRKHRKLHGKEMEIDSTFDLEKKRNTPIKPATSDRGPFFQRTPGMTTSTSL